MARFIWDIGINALIRARGDRAPLTEAILERSAAQPIIVEVVDGIQPASAAAVAELEVQLQIVSAYGGAAVAALAADDFEITDTIAEGDLNLRTTALDALFAAEDTYRSLIGQIGVRFEADGEWQLSAPFAVRVNNSVIRGDVVPVSAPGITFETTPEGYLLITTPGGTFHVPLVSGTAPEE